DHDHHVPAVHLAVHLNPGHLENAVIVNQAIPGVVAVCDVDVVHPSTDQPGVGDREEEAVGPVQTTGQPVRHALFTAYAHHRNPVRAGELAPLASRFIINLVR